jgi:transposase
MSLQIEIAFSVHKDTARVAHAAFPKGNVYMTMRDQLGPLFEDPQFADLFPPQGQPAEAPWRLALVTVMQFAENLPDRQAADAVRSRIDWKYALGLELTDPGFDHTVLSEFRQRLVSGQAEQRLLDTLLTCFVERGLLKARGKQRTDSTHVLAAVRMLNRLETLGETLRHALNVVAEVAPDWLVLQAPPEWYDRYGARMDNYRFPKEEPKRQALAAQIGADGFALLSAVYDLTAPVWLREVLAVQVLRQVWVQQFYGPQPPVGLREQTDTPPSSVLIHSPYDAEAHFSTKRSIQWVGYKVHLTETCEADRPDLITNVETTAATTTDDAMMASIHLHLSERNLLPEQHFADTGYVHTEALVHSRDTHQVELMGPIRPDPTWQGQAGEGYSLRDFTIDWEKRQATCPQGKQSITWKVGPLWKHHDVIKVRFAKRDCFSCGVRALCSRGKKEPRSLTFYPQVWHEALQRARQRQLTPAFREAYSVRSGVEGTISQGVRRCDLRQARYNGLRRVHLQHVLTSAAINLLRVGAWLLDLPRAKTRTSRFAALTSTRVAWGATL